MQFRKKLLQVSFLFFLLATPFYLFAQRKSEIRKNDKGERVIVHEDGSWEYYDDPSGRRYYTPINGGEEGGPYAVFEGEIAPLEGAISITEEDIFRIAVRQAQLSKEAAKIAKERATQARLQREKLEKELRFASSRKQTSKATIQQLNIRLNAAKRTERETSIEANQAERVALNAEQMTKKGDDYIRSFQENQRFRAQQSKIQAEKINRSYEAILPLADSYTSANKRENLILNPPLPSCQVAFEGQDEYNKQWRKDLKKQLLFTHTDEKLRIYLKDKEYLKCEAFLTALGGGYLFLSLQFSFAYPNAREAYGFIEKGSVLTVKMLNGKYVNLRSGKMDRGSYDTEKELLTYQVHYPIDRKQINLLKESELDRMTVHWSSGFEEYEIYQLDFFINQIRCLEF